MSIRANKELKAALKVVRHIINSANLALVELDSENKKLTDAMDDAYELLDKAKDMLGKVL